MRPYDATEWLAPRKQPFAREVFRRLGQIPGVRSVTFVGSFCDRDELAGISDIDVIVICESLDRALFAACAGAMAEMSPALLALPSHRLHVNTTFGPLKFDQPDQMVIHLMIYDRAGHRAHVLKSPFTCFDWERSPVRQGPTLAELYPVLTLQPDDFLNARRSLANYADDLQRGVLSFRRYEFGESGVVEMLEHAQLDERLRGEYAFHIVKNLVQNYAKLVSRQNASLTTAELTAFWRGALPGCAAWADDYLRLETAKLRRDPVFSADTVDFAKNFLAAFEAEFTRQWGPSAQRLVFVRHAETRLNDGTFLGQNRDPDILAPPAPLARKFVKIFYSPLRRARQTAQALQPAGELHADARLAEINYGRAEGLPVHQLSAQFPELAAAWRRGEDAPFPGGENTAAVEQRLQEFLQALRGETAAPILIVTHNVVLRCLLGRLLGLPPRDWHKLRVPHLELFETVRHGDDLHLNLNPAQKAALVDSLLNAAA